MNLIDTTATHQIWLGNFEGIDVRFTKNLLTNKINMSAEDLSKVMGFDSLEQMMGDDQVLDCINESYRETGIFPITKQNF